MKKTHLLLCFIFSFFVTDILAQKNNGFYLAPIDKMFGSYGLSYERALSNSTSVLLTARYTDIVRIENNEGTILFLFGFFKGDQYTQKGLDVELSFRKYFYEKARMNGLYLQPSIRVGDYEITHANGVSNIFGVADRDVRGDIYFAEQLTVYSFSLSSGVNLRLGDRFRIDVGLGVRMNRTNIKSGSLPDSRYLNGFKQVGTFRFGYSF